MEIKHFLLALLACISVHFSHSQNPTWALPNSNSTSGYLENGVINPFPTSDPNIIPSTNYTTIDGITGGYVLA